MKFDVTKDKLIEGLQSVQNVVSTKTTLPILSNVLIKTTDTGLELTTTDLEVGVKCNIEADIKVPGTTTLPARRLFSIVRELPSNDLAFDIDDRSVASIKSGQSAFKIIGLPEEEFPPFPNFDEARTFKFEQKTFKEILKKVSYSISTDETRYVLNGVFLSFKDNKLTVVATDGRRLALVDHDMEFPKSHECDVILPTKAVNELSRLLTDKNELKLSISENQIAFQIGATLLISKLIDGTYPNYRQVLPAEPKERISMERETLQAAVHRVGLLTSDKSNSIKLTFSKNTLVILANTPDVGEAREELPINYKGRDITVAYNPFYLLDPLRNLDSDMISIELTDELSPGVIKNNTPFLYVIMPMRPTS
ncbi:MAG: DNA polymerase III subunit beta [Verrucomicrobiota bacterium]|mgnify:CR=1 FL=1|nr:DNA polymerase III subunit beta [Verrucomicrobiota bacterium]